MGGWLGLGRGLGICRLFIIVMSFVFKLHASWYLLVASVGKLCTLASLEQGLTSRSTQSLLSIYTTLFSDHHGIKQGSPKKFNVLPMARRDKTIQLPEATHTGIKRSGAFNNHEQAKHPTSQDHAHDVGSY